MWKDFYSQVSDILFEYIPDIMVIMESRIIANRPYKILKRTNMPNVIELPPEGFSKGLCVLCKNNAAFRIDIIKMQNMFTHCLI